LHIPCFGILKAVYIPCLGIRFSQGKRGKTLDKIIVDGDTGETVGELNQGDRIVRAASYRSRKDIYIEDINKDKIHWDIKDFFKTSAQEQRLWLPLLSHMERSFLFAVTTYISYDNDLQEDNKKAARELTSTALLYIGVMQSVHLVVPIAEYVTSLTLALTRIV